MKATTVQQTFKAPTCYSGPGRIPGPHGGIAEHVLSKHGFGVDDDARVVGVDARIEQRHQVICRKESDVECHSSRGAGGAKCRPRPTRHVGVTVLTIIVSLIVPTQEVVHGKVYVKILQRIGVNINLSEKLCLSSTENQKQTVL